LNRSVFSGQNEIQGVHSRYDRCEQAQKLL
jgi:hypothetical protein